MYRKLAIKLLSLVCFMAFVYACKTPVFIPQLDNGQIGLSQLKQDKLSVVKAFDTTQALLNTKRDLFKYDYYIENRAHEWDYSSKYNVLAYYKAYPSGKLEYRPMERYYDYGKRAQKKRCEAAPENCPNGFVDTFPAAVFVLDSTASYSKMVQKIYFLHLDKKGAVKKKDSITYVEELAIQNIKFFENRLLIEAQEIDQGTKIYGFIDLGDRLKGVQHFEKPAYLKQQEFRFLNASSNEYTSKFYSLQTDFYSNYSLYEGIEKGKRLALPKIIEEELEAACFGETKLDADHEDALAMDEKWLAVAVNVLCIGDLTAVDDCFGRVNLVAIFDRKTMQLKYLMNGSSYSCGTGQEAKKEVFLKIPNWTKLKLMDQKLYFLNEEKPVVYFLNLEHPDLNLQAYLEDDDAKAMKTKGKKLVQALDSFRLSIPPPYQFLELAKDNLLIHNKKEAFLLH